VYLLYDGHGSVRQITDSDSEVINDFGFDAYGNLLYYTSAPQTALLYTGEYYDSVLRMQYLRNRWTDPSTGRFNRRDEYPGSSYDPLSLHKYTYTHCNPINATDPSGKFSKIEVLTVVSIISFLGVMQPAINQSIKQETEAMIADWGNSAVTCLDKGVQTQRQRDLDTITDPDLLDMTEAFYHEFGGMQRHITYYNHRMKLNALQGIDNTIHAAQLAGAGLGIAGGLAGAAPAKIIWPNKIPHPPNGWPHWSTVKWNAIWRSMTKGDIEKIYVNRQLSLSTGKWINRRLSPDWIEITKSGKYRIYEVVSPSQTYNELTAKGWTYRQLFGNKLEYYDVLNIGDTVP